MNLALSDEQVFLREAARGALSRYKTFEAAREALDGDESALPDLWPTACEAGWPGLLIDESHGGAGLDVFDAMLVLGECGRVLASIPLLGHLPATAILNASPTGGASLLGALASGERRAAYLPASPPSDVDAGWSVDPRGTVKIPGGNQKGRCGSSGARDSESGGGSVGQAGRSRRPRRSGTERIGAVARGQPVWESSARGRWAGRSLRDIHHEGGGPGEKQRQMGRGAALR